MLPLEPWLNVSVSIFRKTGKSSIKMCSRMQGVRGHYPCFGYQLKGHYPLILLDKR